MKLPAAQKIWLGLGAAVAAVVLCTLPFLAAKTQKDIVYVYSASPKPDSREVGFIRELKKLGCEVKVNPENKPDKSVAAVWFRSPEFARNLADSEAGYDFIYSEAYYPFDWRGLPKMPVMLTPYREIYEHYARSNIKSAMFTLGVNTADYTAPAAADAGKKYPLVWYGDNNRQTPLAEKIIARPDSYILGNFWEKSAGLLPAVEAKEKGRVLSQTSVAVVYYPSGAPENKIISPKIAEAAAAGALVITGDNPAVKEMYGDSVITARADEEISGLAEYYLNQPEISAEKITAARRITADKLSAAASARRFKAILDWLKNNSVN